MVEPRIKSGARRIYLTDLLDERGSIIVDRVEWHQTGRGGVETRLNGSLLEVVPAGPMAWHAYIGGELAGSGSDNIRDVQAYLLSRVAFH